MNQDITRQKCWQKQENGVRTVPQQDSSPTDTSTMDIASVYIHMSAHETWPLLPLYAGVRILDDSSIIPHELCST